MAAPTPPEAAPRYRLREPAVGLSDLAGWAEDRVIAELGRPDSRDPGRYWLAPDVGMPPHVERGADGSLRRVAVFGPVPCAIEPGVPYEAWSYHNVRGQTWILYMRKTEPGRREVVETTSYPTGAVF